MTLVPVYSLETEEVGKIELKGGIWEGKIHSHTLHLALHRQLAGKRAGTHSTKTRGEVRGGGKKPWRQKGTGRARAGSIRSPLWRGGGVIFGPHPRRHGFSLPRKIRSLAFQSAVRNLVQDKKLLVLNRLEIPEAKTKRVARILEKFGIEKALFLLKEPDRKLESAIRNLPHVKCLPIARLNLHDLLRFEKVITTEEALKSLEKRAA